MAERTGEGDSECQAHVRGAVKDGAMHGKVDRQEGEEGKKKTIHCSSQFYLSLVLPWCISLSLEGEGKRKSANLFPKLAECKCPFYQGAQTIPH